MFYKKDPDKYFSTNSLKWKKQIIKHRYIHTYICMIVPQKGAQKKYAKTLRDLYLNQYNKKSVAEEEEHYAL